jgi:hypothetical protein
LTAMGLSPVNHRAVAETSMTASSMKGNPVTLGTDDLIAILAAAG